MFYVVQYIRNNYFQLDTNSRLDSNLLLSSVNLPGGELRRKSVEVCHKINLLLNHEDNVKYDEDVDVDEIVI